MLQMVGQGCFGKVFKGRRKQTGKIVAMKFISKRGKAEKDQENLRHEIGILQRLDHENIILLLDWFETNTDFVVVTQFAYGELFEIFQDDKRLPEAEVSNIGRQLVKALNYLHSEKVIHRDMKPQNVLVSSNGTVKLCDFGFARALSSHTTVLTSIKGTPLYMAPELVQEKPYDGSVDLWSLGVICYELFVGQPPFYTNSLIALVQLIISKPVHYPDSMSSAFRSFLKGLLQKDPACRLGWPDLLNHPFVTETRPVSHAPLTRPPARGRSSSAKPMTKQLVMETAPLGRVNGCQTWQAIEPWLPFFTQAAAGGLGRHHEPLNEDFADLCLKVLELYSEVLHARRISKETPKLELQGLELSLTVEDTERKALSLPLSWLLRGLIHIFSHCHPPAVLSRLATTICASQLLKLMKCLCQSHARSWGPAWDVLSDLARLFGLWLRSLLTMGMTKLCADLLCPDGVLIQFLELAPSLIAPGSMKEPASDVGIHHLGTAINSVKCLGVIFSHFSTAASAAGCSSFVVELYGGLSQVPANTASRRTAEAVALLCGCLRLHPKSAKTLTGSPGLPTNEADKLIRSILQTLAALIHITPQGFPWKDLTDASPCKDIQISIRGAIEVISKGMRRSLEMPGRDGEVAAFLWEMRHGDRFDTFALQLLLGLLSFSNDMCLVFIFVFFLCGCTEMGMTIMTRYDYDFEIF